MVGFNYKPLPCMFPAERIRWHQQARVAIMRRFAAASIRSQISQVALLNGVSGIGAIVKRDQSVFIHPLRRHAPNWVSFLLCMMLAHIG